MGGPPPGDVIMTVSPLSGVRVLEVANMIAAPGAAAMMADLGAEVIKVEPLSGDILRGLVLGPDIGPDPWFELDNRGKRDIAVNLGDTKGRELVHRLADAADIFLTNLTVARQEKFEMTAEHLHNVVPNIIHASLTGYGADGPEADRLAYDMTAFFARGGIQSLVREPGGGPAAFRPGQGDHTSSLSILASVLAALRLRDQTGEGQTVEVALMHVAAWTIGSDITTTLVTGHNPELFARPTWPSPLTCRFQCADSRWVAFTMPDRVRFWPGFCRALGRPDWIDDERYNNPEGQAEHAVDLIAACDEIFATADLAEWTERLDTEHLTWAPVQSPEDIAADPQAEALGILHLVEDHPDGAYFTVNAPFKIRDANVGIRGRAPQLGEHSREILLGSGLDETEIDTLIAEGVVLHAPGSSAG